MKWINKDGYTLRNPTHKKWGMIWSVTTWDVTVDTDNPVTFLWSEHSRWQVNRNFKSDLGSIPPPLQSIPKLDRTEYPCSFLFHDCGVRLGHLYHNGLRVNLTRRQVDNMLAAWWLPAEGAGRISKGVIHAGVVVGRIFSL